MRLIDADVLLNTFNDYCATECAICKFYKEEKSGGHLDFRCGLIEDAPTIEPFEKVGAICNENCGMTRPQGERGKWIISEIRCPNCLEYFQTECYSTEELKKCPNCGADMREDSEK